MPWAALTPPAAPALDWPSGLQEEYELCVEMIRLLPVKMKQEMERAIR